MHRSLASSISWGCATGVSGNIPVSFRKKISLSYFFYCLLCIEVFYQLQQSRMQRWDNFTTESGEKIKDLKTWYTLPFVVVKSWLNPRQRILCRNSRPPLVIFKQIVIQVQLKPNRSKCYSCTSLTTFFSSPVLFIWLQTGHKTPLTKRKQVEEDTMNTFHVFYGVLDSPILTSTIFLCQNCKAGIGSTSWWQNFVTERWSAGEKYIYISEYKVIRRFFEC